MTCLRDNSKAGAVPDGYPVQILGNKFIGAGRTALVEIQQQGPPRQRMMFERIFFSNNYCFHFPFYGPVAPTQSGATINLFGRIATVMGNQIKAVRPPGNTPVFASVNFNGMPGPFIGNVTAGNILQHTPFPSPQSSFNLTF